MLYYFLISDAGWINKFLLKEFFGLCGGVTWFNFGSGYPLQVRHSSPPQSLTGLYTSIRQLLGLEIFIHR
jgi:hypothetical protein